MRLFVAINLPASEKGRLSDELQRVGADLPVRWVSPDALHITLKFLGNVSESAAATVREALALSVTGVSPFDVTLGGLGAFPSLARPNLFWVGAQSAELLQLQTRIDAEYDRIGFTKEARAYRPHITVARVPSKTKLRNRALMDRIVGEFHYKAAVRANSADLMRSHLGPRGARYEVLEKMVLH